MKVFFDQLIRDGHLKEFVDQGKTQQEKTKVKPNPKFDRDNEEIEDAMKEDLPFETIHIMGGPHHPNLANKIRGEIYIV